MKKILSMVLVLLLSLSCFLMAGVSAEESSFTPSEEPIIYFEVPEKWQGDVSKVFCHIWKYDGDALANWASKKETCQKTETENLYSYNITKVGTLEEDATYCVIFCVVTASGSELQTYNTLFDKNCFGDTLYCDDTIYENPEDSSKICQAAFWKNQDRTVYGPELQITSIGNIAGSALPAGVTAVDLMNSFIVNGTLDNALKYVDKTAEELLTEIAGKLGVSDEDLADIIASVPSSGDEPTPDEILLGDSDDDGKVNVKDATLIQKHVAGYELYINLTSADADLSGTVNVKDATAIQKWVAGIEVSTPIGEMYTPAV
ncbi:MAG: dockerin type I repeat-containing protein [Ruminococcus sp.]|nr:dockerin type I repeat-containing protein [Ruminococcus sp.]